MKREGYLNSTEEGNRRVLESSSNKKFVFFTEHPLALYFTKKYCSMEIIGKQFSSRPYAFGVKKNSPLKELLNNEILILQREGAMNDLKTKWWNYESSDCKEESSASSQINIQSIGGLFIFMGACFVILTISILVEFLFFIKKDYKFP